MAVYGLSTIVGKRGNIITRCNTNGIHRARVCKCNTIRHEAAGCKISIDAPSPWRYFSKKAQRRTISIKRLGDTHCAYYIHKIMQEDHCAGDRKSLLSLLRMRFNTEVYEKN